MLISLIRRMMLKFIFTKSSGRPGEGLSMISSLGTAMRLRLIESFACSPLGHGTRKLVEALLEPRKGTEQVGYSEKPAGMFGVQARDY